MFWPTLLVALQLAADGRTDDFVLGYMTGSQRRTGDISYSKPGRTISGAISLAVEEINAGPFKKKGKFPLLTRLTTLFHLLSFSFTSLRTGSILTYRKTIDPVLNVSGWMSVENSHDAC